MIGVRAWLGRRTGGVALVGLVVGILALRLGTPTPAGIYGEGLINGCTLALLVLGMVLTFRGNRIINFALVQTSACGGSLFLNLVKYQPLLRAGHAVCSDCMPSQTSHGFLLTANYLIAIVLGIAFSAIVSWLIYIALLRRLAAAPRLVATVATLFVAVVLAGIQGALPYLLSTRAQRRTIAVLLRSTLPPVHITVHVGGEIFRAPDLLTVLGTVVAVVGLTAFLRGSATGVAIRAAAENPQRALTLGVSVSRVTGRLWLIVGLLAGFVGVVQDMSFGAGAAPPDPFALNTLIYVLAVCVLARFVNLTLAAVSAVVVGVGLEALAWAEPAQSYAAGAVFVVVLVVLLTQTSASSRAEVLGASGWRSAREIRPIPPELRDLAAVQSWRRGLAAVGVAIVLGIPFLLGPGQTNLAAVVVIFGIFGSSLLVLTGWAGQISLGQLGLAGIGAYVVGSAHLPFVVAVLAAGLAGMVAAVLIGLPALRLRGLQLAVTTLAFSFAVSVILLDPTALGKHLRPVISRPSLFGLSLDDGRTFYYFCLVMLAIVLTALTGVRRSRAGRTLIAMRDNDTAAQLFGVSYLRTQLGAFAVSGFIAAFGGALYAYSQHAVNESSFTTDQSLLLFLSVIIGGLGSVSSPVIGVTGFGLLQVFNVGGNYQFFVIGLVGLAILVIAPGGLGMIVFNIRDAALRRVAQRYRIVVPSLLADVRTIDGERSVAPITPKSRPGGGTVFVPRIYRLADQHLIDSSVGAHSD